MKSDGYLLAEALVAMAILTVGVGAFYETLALQKNVEQQSTSRDQLARCVQRKWMESAVRYPVSEKICPERLGWREEMSDIVLLEQ